MTIGDAIRLAEEGRPPDGVTRTLVRCLIYVRISLDDKHDEHGVANQMAKLEQKAGERGWTVVYRPSDNDIGVTRKDPTRPGKYRPGYEEAMRLVDARMVDAVLCFKWDRFIREPLDLEYLIPRFDKAGVRFAEVDGSIDLGTDSGRLHARIMIAVAKAEQERKAERQKLAFEQADGHVARQAEPVEMFVEKLVVARLSRPDAADLVSVEEAGVDVAGLREEAAAIRTNLEEMAGDCALGRISRAQMLKATQAGNARLAQIGAELDGAARENVLAPLVAAENAAAVWAGLDISRKRAVIKTLMSVTLSSPGNGARRAFDPATVQVAWNQPDAA